MEDKELLNQLVSEFESGMSFKSGRYEDWNDTEDLYRRYPAAEGKAYLIGGFTANYLQRDNIVIVPIKLGVGWRLGLNGGYLKFSKKGKVLPF